MGIPKFKLLHTAQLVVGRTGKDAVTFEQKVHVGLGFKLGGKGGWSIAAPF